MHLSTKVADKIAAVKQLFFLTQNFIEQAPEMADLYDFLASNAKEFRSVGYEVASMAIGLNGLSTHNSLDNWLVFYNHFKEQYAAHLESGLGWAFAKIGLSPQACLPTFSFQAKCLIFDGIGYYQGLFNGRKTVKNQLLPDYICKEDLSGFDQGLGRQLWYIAKGDLEKLKQLVHAFATDRQADLWRGIGIAAAYIGGLEMSEYKQLTELSGNYKTDFTIGVAWAAWSRAASDTITKEVELACQEICAKTLDETVYAVRNILTIFELDSNNIQADWIAQLAKE